MKPMKPQQKILFIWRILAIAAAVPPAFLCSFLLETGSAVWLLASAGWIALFLGFYLFYLPARYRAISFTFDKSGVTVSSGVFVRRMNILPYRNIRFTTVLQNPVYRVFGLCALRVVAPGGSVTLSGMKRADAENLAAMLSGDWEQM